MPFRYLSLRRHGIATVLMTRRPSETRGERKEKESLP